MTMVSSTTPPQDSRQGESHSDIDKGKLGNSLAGHHTTNNGELSANDMQSSNARHGSTATAAGDGNSTDLTPMDKIETAAAGDRSHSDDHTIHISDTVKKVTQSAKERLYLHHRHKRNVDKHIAPGSAHRHLRLPWHSNNNHKSEAHPDPEAQLEPVESAAPTAWQNIWIMLTTFPYWNMAFWSGWSYSIGSAMFVIDGAWAWTPLQWPDSEFEGEAKYGVPLWFFFGAILYQIGGTMAYLEAVNDGSFAGAAMKRLLDGHQDLERELLDAKLHTFFGHIVPHHHHSDDEDEKEQRQRESSTVDPEAGWNTVKQHSRDRDPQDLYDEAKDKVERRGGVDQGAPKEGEVREYLTWRWWPTWHALFTYHIFELGYVACAIQLFGVTLYGVTAIVILPGILDSLEWWQELGAYWVPQVVASCCFLIASIMFTIMAQDKWYKPKPKAVSWWIGIHAQIGSVGFLLSAVFGLYSNNHTWGAYQNSLSSMWGSFFYMLSGLFQWYEAINVNVGPILAFPNNPTPVLMRKRKPQPSSS